MTSDAGAWVAIASLAIALIGSIIRITMWLGTFKGEVERSLTQIHERKVALGKRVDAVEKDVREVRHEIMDALKEAMGEIKTELKAIRQELHLKADKS